MATEGETREKAKESEGKKNNRVEKFLCAIYELHIYSTFNETLFKGILFLITWVGAVLVYHQTNPSSQILGGVSFLYATSYISEIGMYLNPRNSIYKKIFPFLIIIWAVIMLSVGGAMLFNNKISFETDTIIWLCFLPVAIYILDSLLYYWIPLPNGKVEENLVKKVGKE